MCDDLRGGRHGRIATVRAHLLFAPWELKLGYISLPVVFIDNHFPGGLEVSRSLDIPVCDVS